MLVESGWDVLGVDFFRTSLDINDTNAAKKSASVTFVQADLNDFHVHPQSIGFLLMADYLQHLGGTEERQIFLRRMIGGLAPEGWFFLGFLNINLKNRLKRDVVDAFSGGGIRYERLNPREVESIFL
jgi:2-polyprenyl-3-methyl-5-hydroxy-6-metoxy-1,4-benzoquinol methylase